MTMTIWLLLISCCATGAAQWQECTFSQYAQKFQNRRMANGERFSHFGRDVACRKGKLGTQIEFRYRNTRGGWATSRGTLSDRGRLRSHRPDCYQYDIPQKIATELGLYRLEKGRTIRDGQYRIIGTKKARKQH